MTSVDLTLAKISKRYGVRRVNIAKGYIGAKCGRYTTDGLTECAEYCVMIRYADFSIRDTPAVLDSQLATC